MNRAVVNGEVSVEVPEGFSILGKDELDGLYADSNPDRWGMADEGRGMILSVFWHRNGALMSSIASVEDACRSTEMRLARRLGPYGYSLEGFYMREVCGQDARGFRHSYSANGVDRVCEVTLFKSGRVFYTVYCYSTAEGEQGNRPVLSAVVDSMSLGQRCPCVAILLDASPDIVISVQADSLHRMFQHI
ncbi:MAG: hypothetical protein E7Z69_03130 [Thermoplasmata archaeon]|jgi:hypothetical protein|nr:hypothetical protein [Thermoplasmata archaeon]